MTLYSFILEYNTNDRLYNSIDLNEGLMWACWKGDNDLVSLMIDNGANNFTKGMFRACDARNKNLALFMIEKGANINKCNYKLTYNDINYLLTRQVKKFGKYNNMAGRLIMDKVLLELNIRDVNTIICDYYV